jgi:hypothetical protein
MVPTNEIELEKRQFPLVRRCLKWVVVTYVHGRVLRAEFLPD